MPRRDNAQLTDAAAAANASAARIDDTDCTCDEFRRTEVCDHVLMAAAVRMVRRMIDIHSDESDKPH